MNRGACWATVHRVAKIWTPLSNFTFTFKDSIRKLLELINEFSKVAGYKINTEKSLVFPYTNNEKSEREIKESIPFTAAKKKKRIKYLGINLAKEAKELYTENYKLVVQWLRICLAMQGTPVQSLAWGDPTCHAATKPVLHNYLILCA